MSDISDSDFIIEINRLTKIYVFSLSIILFPIGIILNSLSICVFRRKNLRKTTMSFYNIILSVSYIALFFLSVFQYANFGTNQDFVLASTSNCIFFNFASRVLLQMVSWLSVLLTLDRTIWVLAPNRFFFMKNFKFLSLLILGLFAALIILNSPNFFYKLTDANSTSVLNITKLCTMEYQFSNARSSISVLFRLIIPFTLIVIMNYFLIKRLATTSHNLLVTSQIHKDYSFTYAVVFIDLLFWAALLPNAIMILVVYLYGYNESNAYSTRTFALLTLANCISYSITFYSYAFSFFINFKFNKLFKNELFIVCNEIKLKFCRES